MRYSEISDAECAIAQALAVVGDWWTLLIVRDVAGGRHRFDELQRELGVSRKVLTERLGALVDHGVLERRPYATHPPRFEYHLTGAGDGLMPVLIALQDWGARFVLGDGELSALGQPATAEAERVRQLVGTRVPALTLVDGTGSARDPVADTEWTVLYGYPGAYADPAAYPPGWENIPGTRGCTLEALTFRKRLREFGDREAQVVGVSTQRPDEQARFAAKEGIRFPLLSDQDLRLAAGLRLPTFRAAGSDRLKRVTLLVDRDRTIRGALYPVPDPAGSVDDVLNLLDAAMRSGS